MITKESLPVLGGECTNCARCIEVCDDESLYFSIKNLKRKVKMKISKIILSTVIVALVFIVGCSTQQSISEESLGLRKTDIYTENTTQGDKTMYGKSPVGISKTFKRAFENSPPMIQRV